MIGIIIHRNLLIKYYLCFELFFFVLSLIMLFCSMSISIICLVLYFLISTTFEVVLGLSILCL